MSFTKRRSRHNHGVDVKRRLMLADSPDKRCLTITPLARKPRSNIRLSSTEEPEFKVLCHDSVAAVVPTWNVTVSTIQQPCPVSVRLSLQLSALSRGICTWQPHQQPLTSPQGRTAQRTNQRPSCGAQVNSSVTGLVSSLHPVTPRAVCAVPWMKNAWRWVGGVGVQFVTVSVINETWSRQLYGTTLCLVGLSVLAHIYKNRKIETRTEIDK